MIYIDIKRIRCIEDNQYDKFFCKFIFLQSIRRVRRYVVWNIDGLTYEFSIVYVCVYILTHTHCIYTYHDICMALFQ